MGDDKQGSVDHKARIDFPVFEPIVPAYATNIVIQHYGKEFIVTYYAVLPPAVLTEPDQSPEVTKARLREIDSVPARCVARIVLSDERMVDFLRLMVQNLKDVGIEIDLKAMGPADGD